MTIIFDQDIDTSADGTFNMAELVDGVLDFTFDLSGLTGVSDGDIITIGTQTFTIPTGAVSAGSFVINYPLSGTFEGPLTLDWVITPAGGGASIADGVASTNIDQVGPTVFSAVIADVDGNDGIISDADTAPGEIVNLTLVFTEEMDQNVPVSVTLNTGDLVEASRAWNMDGDVLTISYTVLDNDADLNPITVDISGAQDVAGNVVTPVTGFNLNRSIDTQNTADQSGSTSSDENADGLPATAGLAAGDVLDTFVTTDGETYSFDTGGDAGGAFALVGNELQVADETLFDLEASGGTLTALLIATDDAGNTTSFTHTVTLSDINDLAVVDMTDPDLMPMLVEGADGSASDSTIDGTPVGEATGSFLFTDDDIMDSHSVGVTNGTSSNGTFLGTFSVGLSDPSAGDGQGEVTWTLDDLSAADEAIIDALPAGGMITQTYTVSIQDSSGGVTMQPITLTITGSNDVPTITASATEDTAVVEAGGVANGTAGDAVASGMLTIADVDDGESSFQTPASLIGTYGTFTFVEATGAWTYTLDDTLAATQALNAGDVETDTLTVTSLDGTETFDINVTVNGTNDVPTITASMTEDTAVVEAGGAANGTAGDASASGMLTIADADDGESSFQPPASLMGTYGTFTFDAATGVWGYMLDPTASDALNAGDVETDTLTVTSLDGTETFDINVTVTGSNDNASILGTATGSVIESGVDAANAPIGTPTTATGTMLSVSDVDDGEAELVPVAAGTDGDNAYGTFEVLATGEWTYTLDDSNAAVQALDETQSLTDTITVFSQDMTASQEITVTINGSNDAPFVTGIGGTDFVENSANGRFEGGITEVADLAAGENTITHEIDLQIAFDDFEVADVHTGTINAIDNATTGLTTGDYLGTFSVGFQPSGNVDFSFEVDDVDLDFLAEGETRVQLYEVSVSDDSGGTLSRIIEVTLTGSNDAPIVSAGDITGAVTELVTPAGSLTDTGTITFTDVDLTDAHSVTAVVPSADALGALTASVTTDTTGTGLGGEVTWNYTVDAADVEYLSYNETLVETFTFSVEDGEGGSVERTVSVTITGTNDAPTLVGSTAIVSEDDGSATVVDLSGLGADVDSENDGASLTYNIVGTLITEGSASIVGTDLVFDPAGAFEDLAVGESRDVTVQIQATDAQGAMSSVEDVVITVTGANDAPIVSAADVTGAVTELVTPAGSLTDTGTITFTDVDLTDAHSVTTVVPSADALGALTASVTTDTTGTGLGGEVTWNYTVDAADVEYLAAGETLIETFTFSVEDGEGGSVERTVSVTITGTNDAPVIDAAGPHAIIDTDAVDMIADITGTLTAADVDATDTLSFGIGDGSTVASAMTQSSAYGTLTVDPATGAYSFEVDNAALDALDAGDNPVVTFDIQVTDGTATDTTTLVFNITGANDNPIANADTTAVDEGAIGTFNAVFGGSAGMVVDTDAEGHSLTIVGGDDVDDSTDAAANHPDIDLGSSTGPVTVTASTPGVFFTDWGAEVTLNSDGNIFYNLTGGTGAFQALGEGETAVDTFSYTISDGNGGLSTASISVMITGANDAPVAQDITATAGEDGPVVNIAPIFEDVDASDSHTFTVNTSGTLGAVTINADGTFNYDPNGQFEALDDGETATDSFGYTVIDSEGASSTRTVTVTIEGSNDAPEISGDVDLGASDEDTDFIIMEADLLANATDVDVESLSVVNLTASSGSLVLTAPGMWTFTPDLNDDTDVTFDYEVSDGTVATAAMASLDLTPINDAAMITGDDSGTSIEDMGAITGTLFAADVDNADNTFQVDSGVATYGDYEVDAAGEWTYTLDDTNADVDALNVGDSLTDSFDVLSEDGTMQTVTITIDGANDAALISGDTTGTSVEDSGMTTTGTLFAADVDNADDAFQADADLTTYGEYTVDEFGDWTYTLDDDNPAVNGLNVGGVLIDTFVVLSEDGTSQTVEISIEGTNDSADISAAVISGDTAGVSVEDSGVVTSGQLTATDVDNPDDLFQADSGPAFYGTYDIDTAGAWTYTLNNTNADVDALNVGDTLTDSFVVFSDDGTAQTIVITIDGANDAPTISGDVDGTSVEDGGAITGMLTVSDVDNNDTFQVDSGVATYGNYEVDAAGEWTYTLDNTNADVDALNVGDSLTDTFDVFSEDGTMQTVTITIEGANDAALISGDVSAISSEDSGSISGTLTASDVDNADDVFEEVSIPELTAYGDFTVDSMGNWVYSVDGSNADVEALNVGDTLMDSFIVLSEDGTAQTVEITIEGANDAAIITGEVSGTSVEDMGAITGMLFAADVDNADNTFQVDSGVATYGDYEVDAAGEWTYTLDDTNVDVDALNVGDSLTDSFDVLSEDGTMQTVTITIEGANDAAVISGEVSGTAVEDAGQITGALASADVDNTDGAFQAAAGAAVYGAYEVDAAGIWFYTLDEANAAVDALNVGDSLTDSFDVLSEDGTVQTVEITIDGANDAAVISGEVSGTAVEDAGAITGTLFAADVDNADNAFQVGSGNSTYGTFAVDAAGEWTYTLDDTNADVDALNVGDSLTDSFDVFSEDGTVQTVEITIDGANDAADTSAAVISGDTTGTSVENSGAAATGQLTATDVDNNDNVFQANSGTAAYGSYAVDAAGAWTYTLDDTNADVDALNAGDDLTDTFVVLSEDGTPQTITITIDGANDAPDVTGEVTASGNEDGGIFAVDLLSGASDVDSANLSIVAGSVSGIQSGMILAGSTLNVDPSNSAFQSLPAGQTESITISYDIVDGDGGVTPQTAVITIVGTNDVAVLGGVTTGDVIEDNTTPATGTLTISDTDDGESLISEIAAGTLSDNGYGSFEVLADGSWTFTLDSTNSAVQALEIGETTTDTITVSSLDGSASLELTVTITGAVNYIVGTAGPDVLVGQFDEDDIMAGNSDDIVDAGTGDDVVSGGAGNDMLDGGGGDDFVRGNADDDTISGGAGDDRILGDTGDDTLFGDAGNDDVRGGDGEDSLNGGDGNDSLRGEDGNDTLSGGLGTDTLIGGNGDDSLSGNADNDFLTGGAGADLLLGGAGNDRLLGDNGQDDLRGGDGDDTMSGGADNDILRGNEGDDFMRGNAGDDILLGGLGMDLILGDIGNDRILGEGGDDNLRGGDGDDIIIGGDGNDRIQGNNDNDVLTGGLGEDVLIGGSGDDRLLGDEGNDFLTGGTGDDFVSGGEGADRLFGDDGNDDLRAGDGDDILRGGDGDDILRGNDGNDNLRGNNDNDTLIGGLGEDTLLGDSGDDMLFGDEGADDLRGGEGADYLSGGDGNDNLRGEAGNDVLDGDAGLDRLFGGDGNDELSGGAGADRLFGGAGDDTFVFSAGDGFDRIGDFDDFGDDNLDLSSFGFGSFADIAAAMSQVGNHVQIDLGNGDILQLDNTDINDMAADDFLL